MSFFLPHFSSRLCTFIFSFRYSHPTIIPIFSVTSPAELCVRSIKGFSMTTYGSALHRVGRSEFYWARLLINKWGSILVQNKHKTSIKNFSCYFSFLHENGCAPLVWLQSQNLISQDIQQNFLQCASENKCTYSADTMRLMYLVLLTLTLTILTFSLLRSKPYHLINNLLHNISCARVFITYYLLSSLSDISCAANYVCSLLISLLSKSIPKVTPRSDLLCLTRELSVTLLTFSKLNYHFHKNSMSLTVFWRMILLLLDFVLYPDI